MIVLLLFRPRTSVCSVRCVCVCVCSTMCVALAIIALSVYNTLFEKRKKKKKKQLIPVCRVYDFFFFFLYNCACRLTNVDLYTNQLVLTEDLGQLANVCGSFLKTFLYFRIVLHRNTNTNISVPSDCGANNFIFNFYRQKNGVVYSIPVVTPRSSQFDDVRFPSGRRQKQIRRSRQVW